MREVTSPPATLTLTGRRLVNMRRNMTMKIKCPYCGSEDTDNFDVIGGYDGEEIVQLACCFDCDKTFRVVYECVRVEKE